MKTSRFLLITFYFLLALAPLSAQTPSPATPPFTANLSWGNVEILLRAEPASVMLERDLNVTLTITAPAHQTIEIPDLRHRFQGFTIAEGFARDPITLPDGQRSREYRWRLVPGLDAEYRLAPFAVTIHDATTTPHERSFATRPVVFPAATRDTSLTDAVEINPRPFWIPPTRRDYLQAALLLGLVVVLLLFLIRLMRYLQRQVKLHRMSPHERALTELDQLLRQQLPARGLFKEFYIELTQVVRRYIERAHHIRAPQQTTPEFLASARNHPDFPQTVLGSLRAFLEAADLIKFARQETNATAAEEAVATARTYITDDAATRAANPTSALTTTTSDT